MKNISEAPLAEVLKLRQKVMWPDKEIDFVKIKDDEKAIHYGINEDGQWISVISLFYEKNGVQFRKFATLKEFQNKGYGTSLLNFVFYEAEKSKVSRIFCNARRGKADFYKKFGMIETEETFFKEEKEYVIMEKILK